MFQNYWLTKVIWILAENLEYVQLLYVRYVLLKVYIEMLPFEHAILGVNPPFLPSIYFAFVKIYILRLNWEKLWKRNLQSLRLGVQLASSGSRDIYIFYI